MHNESNVHLIKKKTEIISSNYRRGRINPYVISVRIYVINQIKYQHKTVHLRKSLPFFFSQNKSKCL